MNVRNIREIEVKRVHGDGTMDVWFEVTGATHPVQAAPLVAAQLADGESVEPAERAPNGAFRFYINNPREHVDVTPHKVPVADLVPHAGTVVPRGDAELLRLRAILEKAPRDIHGVFYEPQRALQAVAAALGMPAPDATEGESAFAIERDGDGYRVVHVEENVVVAQCETFAEALISRRCAKLDRKELQR